MNLQDDFFVLIINLFWLTKQFKLFFTYQDFCVYENNPSLWPSDDIEDCGGIISAVFTATDQDASSDLTIGIDWEQSRAFSRDNQRVDNTSLYWDTFTITTQKSLQTMTGSLEVSSKFIDYETVARLELSIYVEDKERE
jgi:hypothetical protein